LKLGVSVGYASFPEDGADCASLISVADADMYRAKREHNGSGGSVDEERRIA
jgi:GGDEF domain-containing protein